jgi:hypothetical protein
MRRVHDASTREKSVSYPPSPAMRHQTSTHPQRFHLAHPPAADYTGPLSLYEEVFRLLRYCSIDDEKYYSALKHRLSRLVGIANQIAEHKIHEAMLICTRARRQMLRQSSASKFVRH